jgi:hypothetical protein
MKYLFLSTLILFLTACQKHDLQFYRTHPRALQTAMDQCPSQNASNPSCEELSRVALDINKLVFELQQNAQLFGVHLMGLQAELATLQAEAKSNSLSLEKRKDLTKKIKAMQEDLSMRLAVVEWLESPES